MWRLVSWKRKSFLAFVFILSGSLLSLVNVPASPVATASATASDWSDSSIARSASLFSLYDHLNLEALSLSRNAFLYGLQGYSRLIAEGAVQRDDVITVIDFSLPSWKKRLFVIDLEKGKLLFNTYVSHGKNSGAAMATRFSNRYNSYQSSPGFYVTRDTYFGQHGFSLRLDGKEKGINDNAMERAIVMHAADYASTQSIRTLGFLGRSLGCPAIPPAVHKPLINTIKEGSCLFIYSPDKNYINRSRLINS